MWWSSRGVPQLKTHRIYGLNIMEKQLQFNFSFSALRIQFITSCTISHSCSFLLPNSLISLASGVPHLPYHQRIFSTPVCSFCHSHLKHPLPACRISIPPFPQYLLQRWLNLFCKVLSLQLQSLQFYVSLAILYYKFRKNILRKKRPVVCLARWRLADKEV